MTLTDNKMENDFFNCTKCGECCRHIDLIPELSEFDSGSGICIHLKNNLCDIYDSRPDICNVDVMYEKQFRKYYSKNEFYKLNEQVCRYLSSDALFLG